MPTQFQIEQAAGIDSSVAEYLNSHYDSSPNAKTAVDALALCCRRFEQGAFGILQAAITACKKEMETLK